MSSPTVGDASTWATRLRARVARTSDIEGSLLAMGALTGLGTGVLAAALILAIRVIQPLLWGSTSLAPWQVVAVPTLGGLVVGLIVTYLGPESSGSGVVRTMETLALRGGRFRRRVPIVGLLATSIALASGASGGREGPIVLMGGATGSLVGQLFRLDEARMRAMVAAGVAAGIGASFNAPIGGMLFAIELILGKFRARSLQVVVVASVVGSVTARELVGAGVTFDLPRDYVFADPRDLIGYLVLGVASAGLGLAFIRGQAVAFEAFTWLRRRMWRPLTLAIGGLGVGAIALVVPEVLGTGDNLPPIDGLRDPIRSMLTAELGIGWGVVGTLVALLVAKYLATMLTIGSGSAVGNFAPTLFTGAALGAAIGTAIDVVAPGAGVDPGAFALVGMAAGFSAAARAPLTAIIIVFELTGDYGMVLPLMLSCGIATWLAERIEAESVYTQPLAERGIVYGELEDIDVLQAVRCGDAMTTDHPTVRDDQSVADVRTLFAATGSHGFAVVDGGHRLVGVVTPTDLVAAALNPKVRAGKVAVDDLRVADIATDRPVAVNPDDPVHTAVHRMAALDIGRVPVVERRTKRLLGMMRRSDVVRAYQLGLQHHLGDQQREASRALRDLAGVAFQEVVVSPGSIAADHEIREVAWPPRTIVVSIRRGGSVVMPTGDTRLQPGDELVVLAETAARPLVHHLATAPTAAGHDPTDPAQRDHAIDAREDPEAGLDADTVTGRRGDTPGPGPG